MEAAADRVGAQLFPDATPAREEAPAEREPVAERTATQAAPSVAAPAPPVSDAPKSWPKEMHEHWGKTDPKVQEYWRVREKQMLDGLGQYRNDAQLAKTFKDVIQPFTPILQAQGLNPPQAVQYLLNAHQRLTQGPPESRLAAYQELGRSLGLQPGQPMAQQAPVDPALYSLQQKMSMIEQNLMAQQQAEYQAAQQRTTQDVEAFASDPSHPHFDEVADDIVLLLKAGLPLQEAYEKAVWANPLTREKNLQARIQTESSKQREVARLNALPKAKAARASVRSIDSRRTPTEPLGKMEDTIKSTLADIRSRVH